MSKNTLYLGKSQKIIDLFRDIVTFLSITVVVILTKVFPINPKNFYILKIIPMNWKNFC